MPSSLTVDVIFNYLQQFKKLPTYQFERRIDAFILPYLEDFINNDICTDRKYELIYPEFPLSIYEANTTIDEKLHSYYADYLLYNKQGKSLLFIEFKTDIESVGKEQFIYYCNKCSEGWKRHVDFFVKKAKNKGPYQKKFAYGLFYLKSKADYLVGCEKYQPEEKWFEPGVQGLNEHLQPLVFTPPEDIKLSFKYLAPGKAESKINKYVEEERDNKNDKLDQYTGFLDLAKLAECTPDPLKRLLIDIK